MEIKARAAVYCIKGRFTSQAASGIPQFRCIHANQCGSKITSNPFKKKTHFSFVSLSRLALTSFGRFFVGLHFLQASLTFFPGSQSAFVHCLAHPLITQQQQPEQTI